MSNSAVVASLTEGSVDPFSCMSLSPSREYAIAAAKDTLNLIRIDPRGIQTLRKLKVSQVRRMASFTFSPYIIW
jgi:hypothetical protein